MNNTWKELAPSIYRQRLIIEGNMSAPISSEQIKAYLSQLSDIIDMKTLLMPVTHQSPTYGWAGWIHWETSGAHFYAWDVPQLFWSVDIYACKPFDAPRAVEFTKQFFGAEQIVYREA